ncbi:endoglucanase 3 [Hordeum vulgare]|nr:endoglucanase 3 [Hordeum vulgare]
MHHTSGRKGEGSQDRRSQHQSEPVSSRHRKEASNEDDSVHEVPPSKRREKAKATESQGTLGISARIGPRVPHSDNDARKRLNLLAQSALLEEEGPIVHEVQAIQYFIDGCRDSTLLKHKLMCSKPTSLAALMAKEDKYAMADSAIWVKVTASDKLVPTPSTPKPAGDNRGGQNNKRKADQLDSRSASKQVANMEEEARAAQASSQR